MFVHKISDSFTLYRNGSSYIVPWTHEGVVWPVDKNKRYRNPPGKDLKQAFEAGFFLQRYLTLIKMCVKPTILFDSV